MTKDYASENAKLIERAAQGDSKAKNDLILNNMRLVHSVVKRFNGRGYETEDLIQIGSIGLIRAANKFDSSFGVKFSTYAVPMVIGEIKRFIRDDGTIKVSRKLKDIAAKAAGLRDTFISETGREPTIYELAEKMDISSQELSTALDSQLKPQSLYNIPDGGEGKSLIESIECDKDYVDEMINRVSIKQILKNFDERDRKIILLRYFKMKTQSEIAGELGISQVQVSRLERKILNQMKEELYSE